jgi:hypothetical protein
VSALFGKSISNSSAHQVDRKANLQKLQATANKVSADAVRSQTPSQPIAQRRRLGDGKELRAGARESHGLWGAAQNYAGGRGGGEEGGLMAPTQAWLPVALSCCRF